MDRLDPQYLTKREIERVEDALSSEDLETMIAVVDDIVRRQLQRQQTRATARAAAPAATS